MLTNLDFLSGDNPFPPTEESGRFQKYARNEKLYDGKHALVFTRYAHTEGFDSLNVVTNWPKRLSLLWADMLFGQEPEIRAQNQEVVDSIIQRNDFWNRAYTCALDVSRYGVGILKIRYDGSRAVVESVSPHIWYPVFNPMNTNEVEAHVLAWTYDVKVGRKTEGRLYAEIHERGKITYRTYETNSNSVVGTLLEEEEEVTGTNEFLVVPIHNIVTTDNPIGQDDYEDVMPLLEEIEMRLTQIGKILNKHADPSMYGDEGALEYDEVSGTYVIRGGGSFFPVVEGGQVPAYLTWDGKLEDNFKSVDALMEQFYAITNTSPASFGQLKGGLAESGSALKRLLMATIMKANRLKVKFNYSLVQVLSVAAELEAQQTGKVWIEWRDALPEDETEKTQNEVARYGVGLTSLESSVRRLDGLSGEALVAEVNKIREQQANELEGE